MSFEINVSKDGIHYFATSERSITTHAKFEQVCADIMRRFPESEGFQVTATEWAPKQGKRLQLPDAEVVEGHPASITIVERVYTITARNDDNTAALYIGVDAQGLPHYIARLAKGGERMDATHINGKSRTRKRPSRSCGFKYAGDSDRWTRIKRRNIEVA